LPTSYHAFQGASERLQRGHPELDKPWLSTNFEVGDKLFFPALTVHKALPNISADRMRISLDNRYEAVGSRIAEHMLVPHMTDVSPLSWEEVYAGWSLRGGATSEGSSL